MASRNRGEMTEEMTNMKLRAYADAATHEHGGSPKYLWWVGDNGRNSRALRQMPIKPTVTILNIDESAPGQVHNNYTDRAGSTEMRGPELRAWCDYSLARALGEKADEPGSKRQQVARPKRVGKGTPKEAPRAE
jgi:hypothetical protein